MLVRSLVSLVIAFIAATGALGQWRNYLLFTNGGSFDATDPQFHNVGFFVFKLPFLSFIMSWAFVTLVVVAVFTVHRPLPQRRDPRAVGDAQRRPSGEGAHLGPAGRPAWLW